MLRKYCLESEKDWDEGVPLVLFAVRETVQESLGFSPAELVFGHTVRGPMKVLKEQFLSKGLSERDNVLDYVSRFRERLHGACALATEALASTQKRMKRRYDQTAVSRSLRPGDQVLVLLPVPGAALSARFSGPYAIERKLSETDYVLQTPDRKRQSRVCHINILKAYHTRPVTQAVECPERPADTAVPSVTAAGVVSAHVLDMGGDGLELRNTQQQCARLANSQMLLSLRSSLGHLTDGQADDIEGLLHGFLCLVGDVPTCTNVLEHDINVGNAAPIKQHAYRVNASKRKVMKDEVRYLLENNLAVPSSSPWSSPCILVPKPDGTSRLCTDYRKVNAVTVPDSYPLPRLDDCIDTIGAATHVTKLDLLKGYWQVPLTPRASDISAFVTPDDFLQYSVMAFGMRNAPATFQRLVNTVLAGIPNCCAYLDDLVVHSTERTDNVQTQVGV